MKNRTFSVIALVTVALGLGFGLIGCASTPSVPRETKAYVDMGDGWVQFCTNESKNYAKILWSDPVVNTSTGAPDVYEMDAQRASGNDESITFGMMFGAKDEKNFYGFLINSWGRRIVKVVNGNVVELAKFEKTSAAKSVFEINTLKALKKGATYELYLNDSLVYTITDTSVVGDMIGFIPHIGTSQQEKFPSVAADMRFKIK